MNKDELYSDRDHRLDTLAGPKNAAYWRMLLRLSDAWPGDKDKMFGIFKDSERWRNWCEENHGFRPQYDSNGYTSQSKIIDPKKYTLCVLKYGG